MHIIILLGLVSLFADITYEGSRSIVGPFLDQLGASGAIVGAVAGFAELLGYGLRYPAGILADRTKSYWTLTFIGYFVNVVALPLLFFAGSWQMAALLIVLERMGKAFRAPSRDTILSFASQKMGRGLGFGIHEALDQTGALTGPLIVALILFFHGSYRHAFAFLAIPAVISLLVLFIAQRKVPHPEALEKRAKLLDPAQASRTFKLYLIGACLMSFGFADFALVSFHFARLSLSIETIPLFYALAMLVDGIAALGIGKLFDRFGFPLLGFIPLAAVATTPLLFLTHSFWIGMIFWGLALGAQESILRAGIGSLVPKEKRGSAYGLFNLAFGLFWFLGNALMGFLYDFNPYYLVLFSITAQMGALYFFLRLRVCR